MHTIATKIRWSRRCAGEYTATHGDHTFEILHVDNLGHWLLTHTGPTGHLAPYDHDHDWPYDPCPTFRAAKATAQAIVDRANNPTPGSQP